MDNIATNFVCPKCKEKISIDEAFKSQLEDKIRLELRGEYNEKWQNLQKVQNEQLEKQKKEIDTFRENELALRKKTQELEEKEKNLELEKERQIDEERKKIREKTELEMEEKYHLKEKEYEQNMAAMKKSLEDAQRKANQGSQQMQGEVLELELEEILKREFPIDDILPVGKGIKGADVVQVIKDKIGKEAGKIVWESKRTKAFGGDWIEKLKEDMRREKAEIAVLVSSVLPADINIFGFKEGVYITSFESFLSIARILRKSIIDLSVTKSLSVGKNEKIEALYSYITSSEFAHKIESMLDTFSKMKSTLDKERQVMESHWAQREKQIEVLQKNTLNIHGSFSGLIDKPLTQIESIEFEEIEITLDDNK
ncbi:MAG: DUF2130 domain-containing protein [Candidatus Daviesbacteria bacterium]|nr:DUF2130 domain-containing protein [Candidatus Daviesbacteria bacterium]